METMETKPQSEIEKQPEAETGKLDSIIETAITQEAVMLDEEVKEAEQQLGISSEATITESAAEMITPEAILKEKIPPSLPFPKEGEERMTKGPVISEQEKMDSKMSVGKKGWGRYWIKRLEPEIGILPDEIRNEMEAYRKKPETLSSTFARYIDKKVAAKRFELEKRKKMFDLKMELISIDERKELTSQEAKDRRILFYDESSQSLFIKNEDGSKKEITFGDLIGDYVWDIRYNPDSSISSALWRKIRKTLALHETKNRISDIYDDELSLLSGVNKGIGSMPLSNLEKHIKQSIEKGEELHAGLKGALAERMITEFLTRIQYNNPNLGMKVEKSNALEDSVLKYDFKLILKQRRGVALEAEDMSREEFIRNKKTLGIQFTIAIKKIVKKKQMLVKAREKITEYENYVKNRVDDIVLVRMPDLHIFANLYARWLKGGKPSGGPEQYLSRKQKLEIFRQATNGLIDISEQELDRLKI